MKLKTGKRLLLTTALTTGALLMAGGAAARSDGPVVLKHQATVRAGVVRLSDLLPPNAPLAVRSRARKVILGEAPMPGDERELTRAGVLRALRDSPVLLYEIEIPPDIEVRRWARRVTREEVLTAIERTLRANGSAAGGALRASDVHLAADVAVTEDAPKLQVTQIQPAVDGEGSRVLLWVTSEPRVPPFWVRLDRPIDLDASHEARARISRASAELPVRGGTSAVVPVSDRGSDVVQREQNSRGAVLVKAGDPVELVVQVGGMRIQGSGIPLGRGREGDEIRVRAVPSGKVLVGTVVGEQIVQVNF